jgi:two-component system, OmpR family, sensor kinase
VIVVGRLFWKIFLGFWLTLLATGAGVGFVVQLRNEARLAEMTGLATGTRAEFAVSSVAVALQYGGATGVASLFDAWPERRAPVLVVDASGHDLLGRTVPQAALARARSDLARGRRAPGLRRVTAPDGREYLLFLPIPSKVPDRRRHHSADHHAPEGDPFGVRVGISLLASLVFSALLAWSFARPVRHLRQATRRLAEGALDTRVSRLIGRRRDEIGDLGRDFDHMAERLQAAVGAQNRLLHDVSHELRSPLARLQVAVGLAHQQPDKIAAALDRIEREAGRLDDLVGQLLTLSRLEAGVAEPLEEYVELSGLLGAVVEDARFEAEASGRRVELQASEEMVVKGRVELLRRAAENVIRNAVRFTPPGTAVEISALRSEAGDRATLRVCDRGPGVPEGDLEALFQPFFRAGGQSASPPGGGFGLGLAIARRAIEAHKGRLRAANRPGGGMCVEMDLPLAALSPESA